MSRGSCAHHHATQWSVNRSSRFRRSIDRRGSMAGRSLGRARMMHDSHLIDVAALPIDWAMCALHYIGAASSGRRQRIASAAAAAAAIATYPPRLAAPSIRIVTSCQVQRWTAEVSTYEATCRGVVRTSPRDAVGSRPFEPISSIDRPPRQHSGRIARACAHDA